MNLTKIVLTGGPCAGKTKVFEALKKHISQKGIKLIAVAETATELINGGVRPYEAKKIMDFQDIVYSLQKCKEDMAQKALGINKGEERCVILFDRAIIDNKAYLPRQEDFDYLLTKYGNSEINLLDSYDYVINLFSLLKILLKFDDLPQKGEIKISYGKCKLKFGNVNEASIELEKLAKEALEYYDKLGWIAMTDNYFQVQKDKLINICYELRKLMWENQGV